MLNDRGRTMILQALLHGLVVLSVALASNAKETKPKYFRLTDAMAKFVKVFEGQYKTKVIWTDMWSETKQMKSLFEEKKFYIKVEGGTVVMGDPNTDSGNRSLLYSNLYDNESNTTQTYTVTHTTIRKERSSVRVTDGFSLGMETSGGLSIKEKLFGLAATVGLKYNSDNTSTDTATKLKTFAVATGVNVPSKRTVRVEWFATTAQSDIDWTCAFTISGYFAMGLNETFQGNKVLIIPAYYLTLANQELQKVGPRHALFVARGVFKKVLVPGSDIYTNDVTDTMNKTKMDASGRSRISGEF
uniref:Putative cytotoxin-like protein n=1 Tax=Ixodes ricinus TaxID=34613 RepID=A0A147BU10_IXORI